MCWINTYLGPPDLVTHNSDTSFAAEEFQQYANSLTIIIKEVPVEAANIMGLVKCYYKPLCQAYEIINNKFKDKNNLNGNSNGSTPKALILQMAVKVINDTAGHDGLVPTLLVFGAYPRMSELSPPAPSISQRAAAIKKAMEEVSKLRATEQVSAALRSQNRPHTDDIVGLPLDSEVFV